MLNDFEMITYHYPENENIIIVPISDVHLGAAEHLEREWGQFCADIISHPTAKIMLCGDLINNATRTSVSNVFDETMRPREQKKRMVEMLAPLRDRVLCSVSGNHERRSGKDCDDDATYDILCKLDLEDKYRENIAFVRIRIGEKNGNGAHNPTYVIAVSHGSGGGMLSGGTINRNERFGYAIDGLDCLVVGHSHKPMISQPAKIKIDPFNNKVSIKPFKVVVATSWLGWGGYAAQKMLLPASLAPQTITLHGKRKDITVTM